jgi:hypothetical protein
MGPLLPVLGLSSVSRGPWLALLYGGGLRTPVFALPTPLPAFNLSWCHHPNVSGLQTPSFVLD